MYDKELKFICNVIKKAGKIATYGTLEKHAKGTFDVVTNKDVMVEKYVIDSIKQKYPLDNIVSEELNYSKEIENRTWVIDPIDGTVNFMFGLFEWGIQLAFVDNGKTQFSVIYIPKMDKFFIAKNANGAYLNNVQINLDTNVEVKDSLIAFADYPHKTPAVDKVYSALLQEVSTKVLQVRSFGAASYSYAMVASSNASAYIVILKTPWDYLPGELLVKEAGGIVRHGKLLDFDYSIVAANENIANFIETNLKNLSNH